MVKIASTCANCSAESKQEVGAINRARKRNAPLYCGRGCSGVARRNGKTATQRKQEKRTYDAQRRIDLADELRIEKAAYHKRTYDPAKAALDRAKKMPAHVEYCRRPEYRAYKQQYDQRYNMERLYGPFWEAARVLIEVEREVKSRATNYEIAIQNDTLNKSLKRKRQYVQITGQH